MGQTYLERRISSMADAIDELDEIARVLRRGTDGPMLKEVARLEELVSVMSTLENATHKEYPFSTVEGGTGCPGC